MKRLLLLWFLLGTNTVFPSDGFKRLHRNQVPREAVYATCEDEPNYNCWKDFQKYGVAYTLDVNNDGGPEILIHLGSGDSGTGGDGYSLVQKQATGWKDISDERWQLYSGLHLRKLERIRRGYHDLRIGRTLLVKWEGGKYVSFDQADFKSLSAALFNTKDPEDAEILWLIDYAGLKDIRFEPRWIARPPKLRPWSGPIDDQIQGITWLSIYKGGVWGVKDSHAFLLLPRSSYLGATDFEIVGDWLVVYGDTSCGPISSHVEIARYQLRSSQLKIDVCADSEIPYSAN